NPATGLSTAVWPRLWRRERSQVLTAAAVSRFQLDGRGIKLQDMATKSAGSKEEVFPVIYGELRRVARRYLGRERRNHTLQPTALVNEAWLRLQNERGAQWQGRTHGLALAAQAMRRLLVDHGRHQKRQKRGGGAQNVALDDLIKAASTAAVPI